LVIIQLSVIDHNGRSPFSLHGGCQGLQLPLDEKHFPALEDKAEGVMQTDVMVAFFRVLCLPKRFAWVMSVEEPTWRRVGTQEIESWLKIRRNLTKNVVKKVIFTFKKQDSY